MTSDFHTVHLAAHFSQQRQEFTGEMIQVVAWSSQIAAKVLPRCYACSDRVIWKRYTLKIRKQKS